MGLAYAATQSLLCTSNRRLLRDGNTRLFARGQNAVVRVNSATVGASLPSGRVINAADRPVQQPVRPGASNGSNASAGGGDGRSSNGVVVSVAVATTVPSTQQQDSSITADVPSKATRRSQQAQPAFAPVPEDVIAEFEHKLEADLQTVGVTLTAILGVIVFWRGVWALLDHFIGDSVVGDICCIIVGLTIVLYIRLSGMKIASFWPPS